MAPRLQIGLTRDLLALLERNGIDYTRCTDFKVEHSPNSGPVYITVTMLALDEGEAEG